MRLLKGIQTSFFTGLFIVSLAGIAQEKSQPIDLHYTLGPTTKITIRIEEGKDPASKPAVSLLLHDVRLKKAFSLSGSSSIQQHQQSQLSFFGDLTLPEPDHMPKHLPKGISIEQDSSTRKNLLEEGMLIIRDRYKGHFAQELHAYIFPIPKILRTLYHFQYDVSEPPEIENFLTRRFSVRMIDGDLAQTKYKSKSQDLLVSIADVNTKSELVAHGTIAADMNHSFYGINSKWVEMSTLGPEVRFHMGDSPHFEIWTNHKPWDSAKWMASGGNSWPGLDIPIVTKLETLSYTIEKEKTQALSDRLMRLEFQPTELTGVENPLADGINHAKVEQIRRLVAFQNQQTWMENLPTTADFDAPLIQKWIQGSNIQSYLKDQKLTMMTYEMKMLEDVGDSVKMSVLLTLHLSPQLASKHPKKMTWLLQVDRRSHQVLQATVIPQTKIAGRAKGKYDGKLSASPQLLPGENLLFANGSFLKVYRPKASNSCRGVHRAHSPF